MSVERHSGHRLASPLDGLRGLRAEFPRTVLVLASGDLVASFGFSLFFPFLTIYLVQNLGASAAQAGLIVAAYALCSVVSGVAGGWLADRIGRRPVLIGSVTVTAMLVAAMALATEAWHVGLIMLLLGCIDPAFVPAARAAVADTVDEARRPRAFGLLGVANALGWIAGPVIGAGLSSLGYPLLFGVSGLLVGSYSLIAIRWLPETRPAGAGAPAGGHHSQAPTDAASPAGGHRASADAADPTTPTVPRDAIAVADATGGDRRRVRIFVAFLPLIGVAHAVTFLWVTTLPIHAATSLSLPTPVWGLLFGLNGLLIVLFQMPISTACERRSKPRLMALSVSIYAAGLGLVGLLTPATAVAGLAVTIALVTVGEMLLMPIVPSFVSELSPMSRRGSYQGIALAASGVGSAVGPPVAGAILDVASGQALWAGAACVLLAVGACLLVLSRWADRLGPAGLTGSA